MKKVSVILLAILYFAISSGMIVNMHYCMNRFSSADFELAGSKKQCETCGMNKAKSHGCCHDEIKLVKLQDDQNRQSLGSFDVSVFQAVAIVPSQFIVTSFYNADETNHHKDYAPPLRNRQDANLLNCVFRI